MPTPVYADLFRSQRYVPAENDSGETIPAHALVRVTGWDSGLFIAAKPNTDGQAVWAAGPLPTDDGETVPLTNDWPAWALYDSGDGTPAVGETWGAGASSWKLRKNEAGFVVVGDPDTTLGIVPVDLPRTTAAAGREPSAAVLTEATGAASGKVRQLNGSFAWTDGSTLTDVIYPVEIGGSTFTAGATSNGILFPDVGQPTKYAFLPVQWATATLGGYVSTTTQTFGGDKTFAGTVTVGSVGTPTWLAVNGEVDALITDGDPGTYHHLRNVSVDLRVGSTLADAKVAYVCVGNGTSSDLIRFRAQESLSGFSGQTFFQMEPNFYLTGNAVLKGQIWVWDGAAYQQGVSSTISGINFYNGVAVGGSGVTVLPSQTGNSGKYLTTDGSSASWASITGLPSQGGNSGKYLTTDGSSASWASLPAGLPGSPQLGDMVYYNGSAWAVIARPIADGTYALQITVSGVGTAVSFAWV